MVCNPAHFRQVITLATLLCLPWYAPLLTSGRSSLWPPCCDYHGMHPCSLQAGHHSGHLAVTTMVCTPAHFRQVITLATLLWLPWYAPLLTSGRSSLWPPCCDYHGMHPCSLQAGHHSGHLAVATMVCNPAHFRQVITLATLLWLPWYAPLERDL